MKSVFSPPENTLAFFVVSRLISFLGEKAAADEPFGK